MSWVSIKNNEQERMLGTTMLRRGHVEVCTMWIKIFFIETSSLTFYQVHAIYQINFHIYCYISTISMFVQTRRCVTTRRVSRRDHRTISRWRSCHAFRTHPNSFTFEFLVQTLLLLQKRNIQLKQFTIRNFNVKGKEDWLENSDARILKEYRWILEKFCIVSCK